ncbi:transcription factor bHLH96-like [Rhodamnia argentea]|uniref:Transcription factor bHLH96-like n=1 Tax=Rhodamnia argentea TaxID=178133 RepID=A0A8B8P0R5_9MYRT|nr:transcription factor bHLH96-like [Rhodamnia argentea]
MALEAVVYPQDPFGYSRDQYYALSGGLQELADEKAFLAAFSDDPNGNTGCWDYYSSSSATNTSAMHGVSISISSSSSQWPPVDPNSSSPETTCATAAAEAGNSNNNNSAGGRRKRRRSRSSKNKEEIENQRMTHIAVERNRRKQMNEYLAVLRSLMPPSYSQRGDQASIIGGAINFVKELEQLLQSMQTHKPRPKPPQDIAAANHEDDNSDVSSPFAEFFSFPQYSTRSTPPPMTQCGGPAEPTAAPDDRGRRPGWAVADIEVTMVESHANVRILSKKRPQQLLQLVAGLQGLRLSVLHLNVTTVDDAVLYSVSVKVEEGCHLNTVDEIAAAVHELLRRIEEEARAFTSS